MTTTVTRADLAALCSNAPPGIKEKLIRFLEDMFTTGRSNADAIGGVVEGTGAIQDATVLTLSPNAAFNNERVLTAGSGVTLFDGGPGSTLIISMSSPVVTNGFVLTFNLPSDATLDLPATGRIPSSSDGPYADDTAAAAAGINIGEWYAKTGGTVVWRQV